MPQRLVWSAVFIALVAASSCVPRIGQVSASLPALGGEGKIHGLILDRRTNTPLCSSEVHLMIPPKAGPSRGAVTKLDEGHAPVVTSQTGDFVFNNVAAGNYFLLVNCRRDPASRGELAVVSQQDSTPMTIAVTNRETTNIGTGWVELAQQSPSCGGSLSAAGSIAELSGNASAVPPATTESPRREGQWTPLQNGYTTPTGWSLKNGNFSKDGSVEQVFPGGLSAHAKAMRIEPGTYVGAQISGNGKLTITTPVRAVLDGCAFQIQEGADVTDTGSGYVINKGEAVMDSGAESEGVHISQVQGGSEGRAFQVETRGVFLRRKDGSFTMKSGRISIRAGILVVEGVGAVFEKGSVVGRR